MNPNGTDKRAVPGFETVPGNYSDTTLAGVQYIDEEAIDYFAGDAEGNFYFGGNGAAVFVCDSGGAVLDELTIEGLIAGLTSVPGGTPLVLAALKQAAGFNLSLYALDLDKKSAGAAVFDLPPAVNASGITAYGEDWLAYDGGRGVFLINSETSEISDIVSFNDILLDAQTRVLGVLPGERILCLSDRALCVLQRVPIAVRKTELTVAVCFGENYVPQELNDVVLRFNTESPDYKVEIQSYYDITKLNVEIIAGKIPDLIMTSGIPFDSYAAKGLFEDLNPYIDADPDITLVPVVRRAMSTGDALYRLGNGFSVWTSFGNADLVGAEPGWTFEEMLACLENAPEDYDLFGQQGEGREVVSSYLLYQNLDSFIDWESGEVHFDTPDFIKLLEFIGTYPSRPEGSNLPRPPEKEPLVMRGSYGRGSVNYFTINDNKAQGKYTFKGFPGAAKTISVLNAEVPTFAMTSTCKEKDAAWQFIRSVVTGEAPGQNADYTFPVLQDKFEAVFAAAMAPADENEPPLGTIGKRQQMSQAQADKFLAMLNAAEHTMGSASDNVLQTIIEEETGAYYEGQKTAGEVAAIIQSRAAIYIAEQT
jgi:hypothetical protein